LDGLPKIAEGKVRDLYEVDDKTLLFVASDRISAYDVIMENVIVPLHLHLQKLNSHRAFPPRDSSSPSSQRTGSISYQP